MRRKTAWNADEESKVVSRYRDRFEEHGYGEKALGWGDKGRQQLRFSVLASHWPLGDARILDLGAGFGDFFSYSSPLGIRSYVGIDVTKVLVDEGQRRFGADSRFKLKLGSATEQGLFELSEIVVISGLFNFHLSSGMNHEFITEVLTLAFEYSTVGVACNFVTDQVDFRDSLMHYQSPAEALEIGLSLTKNCVLRQDYMPFEFSLFLDHRESFDPKIAVFDHVVSPR